MNQQEINSMIVRIAEDMQAVGDLCNYIEYDPNIGKIPAKFEPMWQVQELVRRVVVELQDQYQPVVDELNCAEEVLEAIHAGIPDDVLPDTHFECIGDYITAVVSAVRAINAQPQGEILAVGEAETMPGTSGFTMVCFHADKVPVGTKLYTTSPASQQVTPDWNTCLQISEVPEVDSALRKFAEGETTEDQAVCIVQAVLQAVKTLNLTQD
jgi:hypothetical protein